MAHLNLPPVPVTASLIMEEHFFLPAPREARLEVSFPEEEQCYVGFNGPATTIRILQRTIHKMSIPAKTGINASSKNPGRLLNRDPTKSRATELGERKGKDLEETSRNYTLLTHA